MLEWRGTRYAAELRPTADMKSLRYKWRRQSLRLTLELDSCSWFPATTPSPHAQFHDWLEESHPARIAWQARIGRAGGANPTAGGVDGVAGGAGGGRSGIGKSGAAGAGAGAGGLNGHAGGDAVVAGAVGGEVGGADGYAGLGLGTLGAAGAGAAGAGGPLERARGGTTVAGGGGGGGGGGGYDLDVGVDGPGVYDGPAGGSIAVRLGLASAGDAVVAGGVGGEVGGADGYAGLGLGTLGAAGAGAAGAGGPLERARGGTTVAGGGGGGGGGGGYDLDVGVDGPGVYDGPAGGSIAVRLGLASADRLQRTAGGDGARAGGAGGGSDTPDAGVPSPPSDAARSSLSAVSEPPGDVADLGARAPGLGTVDSASSALARALNPCHHSSSDPAALGAGEARVVDRTTGARDGNAGSSGGGPDVGGGAGLAAGALASKVAAGDPASKAAALAPPPHFSPPAQHVAPLQVPAGMELAVPPYTDRRKLAGYLDVEPGALDKFLSACVAQRSPSFPSAAAAAGAQALLEKPRSESLVAAIGYNPRGRPISFEDVYKGLPVIHHITQELPKLPICEGCTFVYSGQDLGFTMRFLAAVGDLQTHPPGSLRYSEAYRYLIGTARHLASIYCDDKPHGSSSGPTQEVCRYTTTVAGLSPESHNYPENWPELGYIAVDEAYRNVLRLGSPKTYSSWLTVCKSRGYALACAVLHAILSAPTPGVRLVADEASLNALKALGVGRQGDFDAPAVFVAPPAPMDDAPAADPHSQVFSVAARSETRALRDTLSRWPSDSLRGPPQPGRPPLEPQREDSEDEAPFDVAGASTLYPISAGTFSAHHMCLADRSMKYRFTLDKSCSSCGAKHDCLSGTRGTRSPFERVRTRLGKLLDLRWISMPGDEMHDWVKVHKRDNYAMTLLSKQSGYLPELLKRLDASAPCRGLNVSTLVRRATIRGGRITYSQRMSDGAHLHTHLAISTRHMGDPLACNWFIAAEAKYAVGHCAHSHASRFEFAAAMCKQAYDMLEAQPEALRFLWRGMRAEDDSSSSSSSEAEVDLRAVLADDRSEDVSLAVRFPPRRGRARVPDPSSASDTEAPAKRARSAPAAFSASAAASIPPHQAPEKPPAPSFRSRGPGNSRLPSGPRATGAGASAPAASAAGAAAPRNAPQRGAPQRGGARVVPPPPLPGATAPPRGWQSAQRRRARSAAASATTATSSATSSSSHSSSTASGSSSDASSSPNVAAGGAADSGKAIVLIDNGSGKRVPRVYEALHACVEEMRSYRLWGSPNATSLSSGERGFTIATQLIANVGGQRAARVSSAYAKASLRLRWRLLPPLHEFTEDSRLLVLLLRPPLLAPLPPPRLEIDRVRPYIDGARRTIAEGLRLRRSQPQPRLPTFLRGPEHQSAHDASRVHVPEDFAEVSRAQDESGAAGGGSGAAGGASTGAGLVRVRAPAAAADSDSDAANAASAREAARSVLDEPDPSAGAGASGTRGRAGVSFSAVQEVSVFDEDAAAAEAGRRGRRERAEGVLSGAPDLRIALPLLSYPWAADGTRLEVGKQIQNIQPAALLRILQIPLAWVVAGVALRCEGLYTRATLANDYVEAHLRVLRRVTCAAELTVASVQYESGTLWQTNVLLNAGYQIWRSVSGARLVVHTRNKRLTQLRAAGGDVLSSICMQIPHRKVNAPSGVEHFVEPETGNVFTRAGRAGFQPALWTPASVHPPHRPDDNLWSVGHLDRARVTRLYVQSPACSRIIARPLALPLEPLSIRKYAGVQQIRGYIYGGWARHDIAGLHQLTLAADATTFAFVVSPWDYEPRALVALNEAPAGPPPLTAIGATVRYIGWRRGDDRQSLEAFLLTFLGQYRPLLLSDQLSAAQRGALTRAGATLVALRAPGVSHEMRITTPA